ncbi:TetR/AcrR family transcriptional regulator [Streptomyces sp. NPDC055078]
MAAKKTTTSKRRTPRGTLSQDKILAAAEEVLGRDGLDGVTMRSVAAELGADAMSLYRHVRSKDELLLALHDRLVAALPLPPGTTTAPVETVKDALRANYRLLLRHPGLHLLDTGNAPLPAGLRRAERLYAIALDAGLDIRDAVGMFAAINRFLIGCAALQPDRRSWDRNTVYWSQVRSGIDGQAPGEYPTLRRVIAAMSESMQTQEEIFEEGVSVLLKPLEDALTQGRATPQN